MDDKNTKENSKRSLLIIEETDDNQRILEPLLGEKYNIIVEKNVQEGLELLREKSFFISLVILDMEMIPADDYYFLDKTQEDDVLKKIPIIITTYQRIAEKEEKCLEHGAADFLRKPYNAKIAVARIRNVIRLYETARALHEMERDELTGLYTKRAFLRHGEERLRKNPEKKYGILGIDIENFKLTNSLYGEEKCDEFLSYLGNKLLGMRTNSLVGRFGGDQFVCLFEINSMENPFPKEWIQEEVVQNAPIKHQIVKKGIYAPIDESIPLVRCCDRAFFAIRQIKGAYQKDVAFYDNNMKQQLMEEQRIQESMEEGLSEEQFMVYYQPKHDSMSGELAGVEALVRWKHPEYGYMMPGQFIPLFERNGFITKLDSFVIAKVCKDIKRWKEMGIPIVPVSVNISRRDYMEPGWIETQLQSIKEQGIPANLIHMEVTESLYAEHADVIVSQLKKVQKHGCQIEMDDFGAGYSSLGMLSTFPLDVIKLDISFVRQIDVNEVVIENIIKLAHRLGFATVAEGVETEYQYNVLRGLGCDFIQGYYFSKPLSVEEYEVYLQEKEYVKVIPDRRGVMKFTEELEIKNTLLRCVDTLVSQKDAKAGVNELLSVVGEFYKADRAYIFEFDQEQTVANNIFEWCREGVIPQIDLLQNVDICLVEGWIKEFKDKNEFYLPSVAEIKESQPELYEILEPQGIEGLLTAPIRSGEKIVGFIGVDNPSAHTETLELMQSVTSFIITEMEKRRYIDRLEDAGYRDPLTQLRNRRAYYKDLEEIENSEKLSKQPVGIVFADVNGLKRTNDEKGHEAGDRLIKQVVLRLKEFFQEKYIYRMGGDEFIVLAFEESEEIFKEKIEKLNQEWSGDCSASVGEIWLCEARDVEENVRVADKRMYMEKGKYYSTFGHDRRRAAADRTRGQE